MGDPGVLSRRAARARDAPRRGDHRERALLDAAAEMLAAGTFDDASTEAISQTAGISRQTFYFYFASKQALLAHLLGGALSDLSKGVRAAVDSGTDDPQAIIAQAVAAAADAWRSHRKVMCAAAALSVEVPELAERFAATVEASTDVGVAVLRRFGTIPEAADEENARALVRVLVWATERNFYNLMRTDPTDEQVDALRDQLVRVWLRATGIGPG